MPWAIVLLWGVLLSAVPGLVFAQEFVVGVEDLNYQPFYYLENGQYQGAAREILDAFAHGNGLSFKYEPLPVKRLFRQLLDGSLDLKFPDNPNWQPELKKGRNIVYSRPVMEFVDGVMVRPENMGKGLAGLKVLGLVLGFTPRGYQDLMASGKIRLVENASFGGLLEQTVSGRVDGAYINPVVARYQLDRVLGKPDALTFDPGLPHQKDYYRASSLRRPDIIKRLDQFLTDEAELVEAIRKRHKVVY
ncbi:MAG: transporter substrate-binding domain-containing protein [Pseudomonadota bacterium]